MPKLSIFISVMAVLFTICVVSVFNQKYTTWSNGDEVHYLLVSQSIIKDRDLDLENNYTNKDYFEHHGHPENTHIVKDLAGNWKPGHGSLVSLIAAPGYLWGQLSGARLIILIVNLLFSIFLMFILRFCGLNILNSCLTVAIFLLQPAILFFSNAIYPDLISGFLGVSVAGVLLFCTNKSFNDKKMYRLIAISSLMSGILGYLHTKMFLLGVIVLFNYFLYQSGIYPNLWAFLQPRFSRAYSKSIPKEFAKNLKGQSYGLSETKMDQTKKDQTKNDQKPENLSESANVEKSAYKDRVIIFLNKNLKLIICTFLPFTIVLSYYLVSSLIVFGDININGSGLLFTGESGSEFINSPIQVFFGQLLDINRGLIPYAPIFLLVPAGSLIWLKKSSPSFVLLFLPGVIFYIINTVSVALTNVIWFAGWSPPARYIMNIIPFFVPAIGYYLTTLKYSWISRINFAVLFLLSLVLLISYSFSPLDSFYSVAFGRNILYENILDQLNIKKLMFFFLNFDDPGIKDYLFGFLIVTISLLEAFRTYILINKPKDKTL